MLSQSNIHILFINRFNGNTILHRRFINYFRGLSNTVCCILPLTKPRYVCEIMKTFIHTQHSFHYYGCMFIVENKLSIATSKSFRMYIVKILSIHVYQCQIFIIYVSLYGNIYVGYTLMVYSFVSRREHDYLFRTVLLTD